MKNNLLLFNLLGILSITFLISAAQALKIGDFAPETSGLSQGGQKLELNELYKKYKYVLVYFYPKADTPGCTSQAKSLNEAFASLNKKNLIVVGVSTDGVADQKAFHDKYSLKFDLVADSDKKVIKAFQVPTTLGYSARQAYLISAGKIVWMDESASTTEQAADVLKAIDSIESKDRALSNRK